MPPNDGLTLEEILDELDPEWRSRFGYDAERAEQFYRTYNSEAWHDAIDRLS